MQNNLICMSPRQKRAKSKPKVRVISSRKSQQKVSYIAEIIAKPMINCLKSQWSHTYVPVGIVSNYVVSPAYNTILLILLFTIPTYLYRYDVPTQTLLDTSTLKITLTIKLLTHHATKEIQFVPALERRRQGISAQINDPTGKRNLTGRTTGATLRLG